MKSILQHIALLSSILLIVSCGGGGGTASNVAINPAPPSDGATGQAVKGIISGATVTITDSGGVSLTTSGDVTTGDDGTYSLTFSEAQVASGLTAPFIVSITGGSSLCDYDVDGTTDDCPVGDGTFVAFGEAYALGATFALNGIISAIPAASSEADPIVTINVSPASEIAVVLARRASGGAAVSAGQASTASNQVLGIIAAVTGVNLEGLLLNEVPLEDATAAASTGTAASAAMTAFAGSIFGQFDATNTSLAAVIAAIAADITVNADGTVSLPGNRLAGLANAMNRVLTTLAARGNAGASAAAATARRNALVFAAAGTGAVKIAPVGGTGDEALDASRAFISNLAGIINDFAELTGAGGTLANGTAPTEVFAASLANAEYLGSATTTAAFDALEREIVAAEEGLTAAGEAMIGAQNESVSGTIALGEDGVITVTDATASSTNATNGVTVTVVVSGTRTTGAGTAVLAATSVTVTTTQLVEETSTTLQTFTGTGTATYASQVVDLGLTTLVLDGDITTGAAGGSFGVNISLTEVTGTDGDGQEMGKYSATFDYSQTGTRTLTATITGDAGIAAAGYALTSSDGTTLGTSTVMGSGTRVGTVDTHIITDGTVSLTATIDGAQSTGVLTGPATEGSAPAAQLSVGTTNTGTVDADGVVRYSDGSIQSLPAAI